MELVANIRDFKKKRLNLSQKSICLATNLLYKTNKIMKNYWLLLLGFAYSSFLFAQAPQTPQLSSGNLVWMVQKDKYGLFNTVTKAFVVPPKYDKAEFYGENLSMVKAGKVYSFLGNDGELLTEQQFDTTINFSATLVLAKQANKFVLIPKENLTASGMGFAVAKLTLDEEYDNILVSYTDNFAVVERDGKFGYIDENGDEIIGLQYENASLFDEGVAAVAVGGKWGAIDKTNAILIDFKYEAMSYFLGGQAIAKNKKNKWGLIDKNGVVLIAFKYNFLTRLNDEGVAIAQKGKGYGLIDVNENVLAPFQYEFEEQYAGILQLCEGYVWLKKVGKWGTINLNGETVIPFRYDILNSTDGETARVWLNDKLQIIDNQGNCLQNCE